MTSSESTLHPVRRESEERRDPREVFREFLAHLGRAARRRPKLPAKADSWRAVSNSQ